MAQCVIINAGGQLEAVADSPCTSLVVLTPPEYAAVQSTIWNLSLEDGAVLAAGIVTVWAAAFGVRAVIRALHADDVSEGES